MSRLCIIRNIDSAHGKHIHGHTFRIEINFVDKLVNNMVGNLSGIICDGAKDTCALKIYSSLIAASVAVELALVGKRAGREAGIVGDDSLSSINHLTRISHEGMEQTNRTILQIMLEKSK